MRCSACGSDVAAASRVCATCGANLAASAIVTAPPATVAPAPAARGFRLQAEDEGKGGRFPVGIILGERYRILGLLGRGGTGEVYRAHDLKLEQQVALKFLPEAAASNPILMERGGPQSERRSGRNRSPRPGVTVRRDWSLDG